MPKKLTIGDCHRAAEERGGKCLETEYVNAATKIRWVCAKGHEWAARFAAIRSGHWCQRCGYDVHIGCSPVNKHTIEKCISTAIERGGECLSSEYVDIYTSMIWKCKAALNSWIE
jgi:hypothetical protein